MKIFVTSVFLSFIILPFVTLADTPLLRSTYTLKQETEERMVIEVSNHADNRNVYQIQVETSQGPITFEHTVNLQYQDKQTNDSVVLLDWPEGWCPHRVGFEIPENVTYEVILERCEQDVLF